MNNLRILSMNFDDFRPFFLNRKRSKDISNKRPSVVFDCFLQENMFDVFLLQGKDTLPYVSRIINSDEYYCFLNLNSSTAIVLHNYLSVVGCSFFDTLGNAVVIPNENNYLALFSVDLSYKRQITTFKDIYLNYALPRDYHKIESYIVGGSFFNGKVADLFAEEFHLTDVSKANDGVRGGIIDDNYRLLMSSDLEAVDSYHHADFVKEQTLIYSPISGVIKNKY